jgi:SAM-dependent methyltransferase
LNPWNGSEYQRRFDDLAASGVDVHGEAAFVMRFSPSTALDAGCGTGRVAIELARRGVNVVGVDVDSSMLSTAEQIAPDISWIECDLASLDLGQRFDVVVMAGNVPLFTPAGSQRAMIAGCARHVGGVLVSGFQLHRGYSLSAFDDDCAAAGLELAERYATWGGEPFADGDYAVSVHRGG